MYEHLRDLCGFYLQDWDLVYKAPTDPIDQFRSQTDAQSQIETLREMVDFYQRFQAGERSHKDLVKMGLEYTPGADRESLDWFRDAIGYLRARTQGAPPVDAAGVMRRGPRKK
jgi:hypothetical protein